MTRHALIKFTKIKDKLFKTTRKRQQIKTRESPYSYQLIFHKKFCRAKGNGAIISQVMKGKYLQVRTLYPARFLFRFSKKVKAL